MQYRIRYNTDAACWNVELAFGLWSMFFRPVKNPDGSSPLSFRSHTEASDWVESVGLDQVYKNLDGDNRKQHPW